MDTPGSTPHSHFAACIGLDWADSKHDVCLQAPGTERRKRRVIEHHSERIDEWARELHERFAGQPVVIVLELTKGPIVYASRKYEFIVLFPINPASLAKYRDLCTHSGAKDDPTDAEFALEFFLKHPEILAPLNPQSAQMRALEQLVEMRGRLVDDQTRIINRITAALKNDSPQTLQWFRDKDSIVFCDYLQRWPIVKAARQARRATLERFSHQHNVRHPKVIGQRIAAIKSAVSLTDDEGVIEPHALLVQALIRPLRATLHAIETFDDELATRAPKLPDFAIFDSFPAAGPTFAPRLLCAFGEQRKRCRSPADMQRYAGVAPVTERSGNSTWVHWR